MHKDDIMKNATVSFSSTRRDFLVTLASWTSVAALAPYSNLLIAGKPKTPSLSVQIDRYIKALRRQGKIAADERTSWSVYDFTDQKKLLAINEDIPRQAASMIKPFIAQAFFYRAAQSKSVRYSNEIREIMERMIRYSSNSATNQLIRLISRRGPRDVERILKRNGAGIFQQTRIVEAIPRGGKTYRNKASAHDYSRFLYALWNESLPYAKEMKALLALPNRDRIVQGVPNIPTSTITYDKTGTTARLCGNMGILAVPGKDGKIYPYTLVAIIEKSKRTRNYTHWAKARSEVIRNVSNKVYQEMKKRHPLV